MSFLFSSGAMGLIPSVAALFTGAIGALALIGWLFGIPALHHYPQEFPGIKTNAALGLVLGGLALGLLGKSGRARSVVRVGRASAAAMILLGSLTLVQYLLGVDLGIDQLIAREESGAIGTEAPNRMAAMTALNLVLKGWALLVLDRPSRRHAMTQAQLLSLLTALGPLAVLLSFLFGVRDVRGSGPYFFVAHMAMPMALAWLALSIGTMFARADVGIMRTLTRSTFAAFTLRRLLVPVLVVPPVLAGLLYGGAHRHLFLPGYGAALFAVIAMAGLSVAIWRTLAGIEALEERERETEAARRRIEADLQWVFQLAPIGIAEADLGTGRFTRMNRKLCEMLGYDEHELRKLSLRELVHPEDLAKLELDLVKAAAEAGSFHFDGRCLRKGGAPLWVHVSALVVRQSVDDAPRIFGIVQDMTQLKEEEEALLLAKEIAESASRMKSAFLANVSHELRTPLTAVAGFAELLLDDVASPEEKRAFASAIRRNGEALTRIIDDLLDLSKVEAGRIEIEIVPVSVPALVRDVDLLLRPRAVQNGIEFKFEVDGPIPERISSDPGRLRQILVNIIGNAIKFTHQGAVRVHMRLHSLESSRDGGQLAFIVEDTGPGISEEQKARLFQPFSQADSSTTRRYGGTGLGLALSKQLAEALNGDVELTASAPGRGSTFTVTVATGSLRDVPLISSLSKADIEVAAGPKIVGKRLLGKRVLLAEDAPDNQLLVQKMLSIQGAQVAIASNGIEAVREALTHDFDVVLMDLQMPEMDGFDATRLLRRRGYSRPIIALTAHAMKEERERSLAAGCDDHLTKPINIDALVRTLARLPSGEVRRGD
jgi:PAS domain S-box-containing protein